MTADVVLPDAHALVVGIANYQRVSPLPETVLNDARSIHTALVDPALGGYPAQNARLLLDADATRVALQQALADLQQRCTPESTLFVYLSCHGARNESGEYILPVDADVSSTGSLAASAISGQEFTRAVRDLPVRKLVVAIDACHAGGFGQPKDAASASFRPGLSDGYYESLRAGRGRAILASCRETEYSWVLPGAQNSLFTEHLLGGMRDPQTATGGLVRIFDLFEYLQPRVTAQRADQHPVFKADLEENFPVALCLGGAIPSATPKSDAEEFRFDAYISYADQGSDTAWVWDTLVPRLTAADLRVAVSGDVDEPGVARVVSIERGIRMAKRTLVVLSETYLADHVGDFESVLAQSMGLTEGAYRLLPLKIAPIPESRLPVRLGMLATLDFTNSARAERAFARLVEALRGPLPVAATPGGNR